MKKAPNIDISALLSFLALAETTSFTAAATRVGRTQSAISQQIKKLEESLEKPLFLRSPKHVSLTSEGELFIGYAKRMLALHQEMFSRFHEPEVSGEIHFGLPEDVATLYLPEILSAFSAAHPRIILHVECDLTLNLKTKFENGGYDLVILKQLKTSDHARGIPMWSEHLEWVASPAITMAKKPDFLPLVLSPMPCVYRKRALEALDRNGLAWQIVYTSPSFAGTVAAVKAGLGITVLPGKMIPEQLTPLNKKYLPDLHNTHIALLTKPNASAAVRAFEEYVSSRLK